jgi:hypothetical protein
VQLQYDLFLHRCPWTTFILFFCFVACLIGEFDQNCDRYCQCQNGKCDHVTRNCTCYLGWTGATCNNRHLAAKWFQWRIIVNIKYSRVTFKLKQNWPWTVGDYVGPMSKITLDQRHIPMLAEHMFSWYSLIHGHTLSTKLVFALWTWLVFGLLNDFQLRIIENIIVSKHDLQSKTMSRDQGNFRNINRWFHDISW